jgi:DNA topoisomerase-2
MFYTSIKNHSFDFKEQLFDISIQDDGTIIMINDGNGIEIVKHSEYQLWIPELIFGELLTSSNYNDDIIRTVGGVNGLGIKLANIFSKKMKPFRGGGCTNQ